MYILYIYIFFSYKSQNILPKWEDLQSLDLSCVFMLFHV